MWHVIKKRRTELGLSQAELADLVGLDKRQIRRYEANEAQPTLPVAKNIANALGITLDELAGDDRRHVDLDGDWWACWQTWHNGSEVLNPHQVHLSQRGDDLAVVATTRGTQDFEAGGYLWRGELRVFDNESLIGWYVATEGAVRSKGSMYFSMHPHGNQMTGRWVGLSHDGPIITGWAGMARSEQEAVSLVERARDREETAP